MRKNENRPGYKKTKAGWIPEEWGCAKLSKFGIVVEDGDRGKNYPKQTDFAEDGHCLFLNAGNVTMGGFSFKDRQFISQERDELLRKGKLKRGDIIVTTRGTIGNFAHYDNGVRFSHIRINSGMAIIRNGEKHLFTRFLYHFFASSPFRAELRRLTFGSAVPQLTIQLVNSFPLVAPHFIPEQEAIAGILECWDKVIRGYEKKIEKKKNIKKGLMQRLLSGKQRLPGFFGEWSEVRLGEECKLITKGTTPTSIGRQFQDSGINFVKIESLSMEGRINESKLAHIDEETHSKLARSQLKQNDILVSIAGALGRTAIVTNAILPANTNQALALVRLRNKSSLNVGFLFWFLNGEIVKSHIRAINVQAAQANISLKDIADFKIHLPTLLEQQAITSVLSSVDAEISALEQKLAALKEQKRFLLNNLVTGSIRLPEFCGDEVVK